MSETQPTIDFLILADRAEALNGKLYLMGGGWDVLAPARAGEPVQFSAALGILVPWLATNIEYRCLVRLENADGARLLDIGVGFTTGRPPNIDAGATQRVLVALPIELAFPSSGPHVAIATLGAEEKRVAFQVRLQGPARSPAQA